MSLAERPPLGVIVRSAVYCVWLFGLMLVQGLVCLPLLLGPRRWTMAIIRIWAGMQLWGLRRIVGLRVEFRGLQHCPSGSAIVAAKHQGQLDTIAPLTILADPCYVLKRELTRLPIFGWYAKASDMIPVDRGGGSAAVKALSVAAAERLKAPRQILIFPEGTRKAPGAPPSYKSGVAALYRDLALPCIPMATNSGLLWPAHGLVFRPGVVVFEFLEPIPPGLQRARFMRTLEQRIEKASTALLPKELRPAPTPRPE